MSPAIQGSKPVLWAPLTSFSWNEKAPSLIVTSSIDTTCTIWNIDIGGSLASWTPSSCLLAQTKAFKLSICEVWSIRLWDPAPKNIPSSSTSSRLPMPPLPLLRIAFKLADSPADSNYISRGRNRCPDSGYGGSWIACHRAQGSSQPSECHGLALEHGRPLFLAPLVSLSI